MVRSASKNSNAAKGRRVVATTAKKKKTAAATGKSAKRSTVLTGALSPFPVGGDQMIKTILKEKAKGAKYIPGVGQLVEPTKTATKKSGGEKLLGKGLRKAGSAAEKIKKHVMKPVKKITKPAKKLVNRVEKKGGAPAKAIHAAKVVNAGRQLGHRLANPTLARKMLTDAARGKGLVLPGSNYIGPGNPMNRKPLSKGDALAKEHDEAYEKMLRAGYNKASVYGGYSDADARLMKNSDVTTPEGLVTYTGMAIKKGLHKAGLTGDKISEKEVERHLAHPSTKRQRSKKFISSGSSGRSGGGKPIMKTSPSL